MSWRIAGCAKPLLLLAVVIVGGVAPVFAADRDTVYTLPGVEIEEARPAVAEGLAAGPAMATVLIVDDLPSRVTTTSEVLSSTPGVHVRRFGGLGSYTAVSVRGSNPNQVRFYLDGVPLNHSQFGVVNAAEMPLAALERVEVYRGAAPIRFADAGGGVVHLVTRQGQRSEARGRLSYGNFDTQRGDAWAILAGRRASLFTSYQFLGSRGAFSFLDDNATPFNQLDDQVALRENNVFRQHGLTTKLDIALGGLGATDGNERLTSGSAGRLILGADLFTKDTGLPGLSADQSSFARFKTRRGVASATWESPAFLDRSLDLRTQLYGLSVWEGFRDLEKELGTGVQDTDDRTATVGLRQEAWVTAGPLQQRLGLVGEWKREEYRPGNLLAAQVHGPVSRRDVTALGAETRLVPWGDRLALFGDLRYEKADDDFPEGPAFSGGPTRPAVNQVSENTRIHAGLLFSLPAGFTLRANAARSHRLPTLFELYGNRGTVVGSRDLVPERLDTQDIGLTWDWRAGEQLRLNTQVSFYRSDAKDLILFIQNSQNTSVARNISGALLQGIETAFSISVRGFSVSANWTYQYTEDRSPAPYWNGNQLPGRPPHEVFTRTQFAAKRWRLFHEYEFISANFLDRFNRQEIGARHLHNAGAGLFLLPRRLELTGEIRNLTDNRVHDVAAYPLPGRALAITLEARL
jgi:iron complex outermembrane receptor protein